MAWVPPKIDWSSKEYYNFEDLNRVEINTEYIAALLNMLGYNITLDIIKNRNITSIEFANSINRVESNINTLKKQFYKPLGWMEPEIDWEYNDTFNYEDANRLENNLLHLFNLIKGNIDNFRYCGAYMCGEEVI